MSADVATADKAPELRPKRPVYASYGEIIRTLVVEAQNRVRSEKQPDPIPPVPNNRTVRKLAAQYAKHTKLRRRAEHALSAMNLQVRGENGGVEWTYSYRNRLNDKPSTTRQKRMAAIARLRVQATIDTMDLTPAQAKTYLLAFERKLAKS